MTATVEAPPLVQKRAGKYQPTLDGLRAFAVVGALLFHAGVLGGGFLGVDLFFVLSGYLITGLLLSEGRATKTIDLARFYTRRFRRLAPALVLVLLVTLVWAYRFAPSALAPAATKQVGWSLAYLNNWYALFGKIGYWGAGSTALPLNHLWSLAIEEQFYLVWPVLILLLVKGGLRLRQFRWAAIGLLVASGTWQWVVADLYGTNRAYLGTDTRFVALAIGATIAVLVQESATRRARAAAAVAGDDLPAGRKRRIRPHQTASLWNAAVAVSTLFLAVSWLTADLSKTSLYHGWLVACSGAAGVLIAAVVTNPASPYARLLSVQPLVWVGKRSYSLYIWHWPIWIMVDGTSMGGSGAKTWIVRIVLTVIVSMLSYTYVEQPIRNSSLSGRKIVSSLGPLAAGAAAVVVIAPPVLPVALGSQPVLLGARHPASAASSPGLRIMVTGDSWARNMGYALALADPAHRATIINLGIPGCGLLTLQLTGCATQLQSWAHAEDNNHPDAALLVEGTYDQGYTTQYSGTGAVCAPAYRARYGKALDTAISTLHGRDNLPVYITTVDTHIGDVQSTTCMNQMLTSAAKRNSATVFDLGGLLCPTGTCVTEHDGEAVLDETKHLAPSGQRWAGGQILAAMRKGVKPTTANARSTKGTCQFDNKAVKAAPIDSYTAHPKAPYLDSWNHSKLTDGVLAKPTYDDPAWVGWQTTTTDIVEYLGGTVPVCSVSSDWLQELPVAVEVPPTIDVYVSKVSGQLGKRLGSAQAPQIDHAAQKSTLSVHSAEPISGQYVTLRVNSLGDWAMADEVGVEGLPASP